MLSRTIPLREPLDLCGTLRPLRRGTGDPCHRFDGRTAWRATRNPDGPATLCLQHKGDEVVANAWGPGAEWALEHVPALVGEHDRRDGFDPAHPLLHELDRRLRGLRICRSGAVTEALVPTVLEQKVTGKEARRAWRGLVATYGEPAPGPAGEHLRLPPEPEVLASLPYWGFHRFGVERRRADTVRRACARAVRLEEAASMPLPDAYRRLTAFPGVGVWTAAEVAIVALGDPDAVSIGDYHLPSVVSWALAGEPRGDDERMLELLEPYRGHRGRVIRLLESAGIHPPAFGPRQRLRSIARI
jgi:3-methyladenine DNA glycosylase/8-oxoguanine DNA glycosylase